MNWCGLGNYAEPELVELNISNDRFKGIASSSRNKSSSQSGSRRKSDARDQSSSSRGRSSSSKGRQSPSFLNPESRSSSKPPKAACVQKLEKGFDVVRQLQNVL